MRKIILAAATATSVLLAGTAAFAGPFGIKMGASLKELKVIEQVEQNSPVKAYYVSVPQPNSEFDGYLVMLTPETGVCKIMAIGKTNQSDRYGTAVKASYGRLKAALGQKYGQPTENDALSAGALWKNSEDYSASLHQNERTLSSIWMDVADPAREVANIELSAKAISLRDTYIVLDYELNNYDRCYALHEKADSSGL